MRRTRVREFGYPKVFVAEKKDGAPVFQIDDRYAGEMRPVFGLGLLATILLTLAAGPAVLLIAVPVLYLIGARRPLRLSFDAGEGEARGIARKPLALADIRAFTAEPHAKAGSRLTERWRGMVSVNAYHGPLGGNRAEIARFTARGAEKEAPAQIRAACEWCHKQALQASAGERREPAPQTKPRWRV